MRADNGRSQRGKTILVVEDDAKIASALTVRLKSAGYDVFTSPDGAEALKIARTELPDLIILDVWLPLIDIWMPLGVGFSVARRLKDRGLGNIPIIFITASRDPAIRDAAQAMHAAAFFEKPYDPEELLSTISRIWKDQSRTEQSCAERKHAQALARQPFPPRAAACR
jgi:DNA-binding response OmpR family regulator